VKVLSNRILKDNSKKISGVLKMKRALLALLCAATFTTAHSQTPQKIHGFADLYMPHEFYAEQMKLWQHETERNPKNADAWFNLFKATRYDGFESELSGDEKKERMDKLFKNMERAIPNTFEYHYAMWWNGGNDDKMLPHLEKAYALKQDYAELGDDFATHYELQLNEEKKAFFAKKWYETRSMAPGLLKYHYNVLQSLEPNAVIVTCGDNDTYPIWLLQYGRGLRPDVTVLNTGLIAATEYREKFLKKHRIGGDASLLNEERFAEKSYDECLQEFLKSVAENTKNRPVYFGLTIEPNWLKLVSENLYVVGLANKYSEKRIDNIALLKKNWEAFHLDYLNNDFYDENYIFNEQRLPEFNLNYVVPAKLLFDHYTASGESFKAETFKNFAVKIGADAKREAEVDAYFKGEETEGKTDEKEALKVEESAPQLGNSVEIFPNPANTILSIRLPKELDAEMEIADMQGRVLKTIKIYGGVAEVNVEPFATGNYILRFKTAQGDFSKNVHITR
jgi:hypothetical protein